MAYRVEYASLGEEKRSPKRTPNRFAFIAVVLVICIVMGATAIHTGILPWVREVLLPGDSAVTAAALEHMVSAVLDGCSLPDAVSAFCQEILVHGSP